MLYFKFMSEDWGIPQQDISLSITPPSPLTPNDINEWLHGPLWAESEITRDGRILARCRHLPPHTYLEVRALYPPDAFPETQPTARKVRRQILQRKRGMRRWSPGRV